MDEWRLLIENRAANPGAKTFWTSTRTSWSLLNCQSHNMERFERSTVSPTWFSKKSILLGLHAQASLLQPTWQNLSEPVISLSSQRLILVTVTSSYGPVLRIWFTQPKLKVFLIRVAWIYEVLIPGIRLQKEGQTLILTIEIFRPCLTKNIWINRRLEAIRRYIAIPCSLLVRRVP